MALSPFYGWAEPDNSSLVKNGAQDIRALGDAIDTSVWNVGFGQAAKNKIINGDFRLNQRAFTSTTSSATYGLDRWRYVYSGGTTTYSTQTFTVGSAPVAGYEGINFARLVTTGQSAAGDFSFLQQRIESVRTFAGQSVTFSLWAKANSGTPNINVRLDQTFGTGGSPSAAVTNISTAKAISTSWARYSFAINVASISGKTIGTNGDDFLGAAIFVSDGGNQSMGTGAQNNTFDIWGVQVEYGSKATPFQTAGGGSPQAELAMCQRYYWRISADTAVYSNLGNIGTAISTAQILMPMPLPVTMRITPTALDFSNVILSPDAVASSLTPSAVTISSISTRNMPIINFAVTGATQFRPYIAHSNNTTSAFIGLSAEL
jgi:hypothetical protein